MTNSHPEINLGAMKKKRLSELKTWFAEFKSAFASTPQKVEFISDAAERVNDLYWHTVQEKVRPKLEQVQDDHLHTIDRHKIISVTELAIIQVQPIAPTGLVVAREKSRLLNAHLALVIGQDILLQWARENHNLDFDDISDEPFEREHISWLCQADVEGFPIFSNAATWYMYEKYLDLKFEK